MSDDEQDYKSWGGDEQDYKSIITAFLVNK